MSVNRINAADVTGDVPGKLWHDCLYEGLVTTVAGPSGGGKSLIAVKLVADLTVAGHSVIYCPEEDPLMLSYRLRAAGADLTKVIIASYIVPRDMPALEADILAESVKLVVFDTAMKHIDGPMQRWDKPLDALDRVAYRTRCSFLFLHHTNKNVKKSATWHAAIGGASGGLAGTSRKVHLVGPRPDDANHILMANVKDSYGPEADAIAFEFHEEEFDQSDGSQVSVSHVGIAEKGVKLDNKTEIVCVAGGGEKKGPNPEQLAKAAEFLTETLKFGPVPAGFHNVCASHGACGQDSDVCPTCGGNVTAQNGVRQLGEDQDISWGTIKRARPHLKIENSRKGAGKGSVPYMRLPDGHPALIPGAPTDLK